MSIMGRAASDAAKILTRDTDPFTLIDTASTEHPGRGMCYRIEAVTDPETGVQVKGEQFAITGSMLDIGIEPREGWWMDAVDVLGNPVSGAVKEVLRDWSTGMVTMFIEAVSDV